MTLDMLNKILNKINRIDKTAAKYVKQKYDSGYFDTRPIVEFPGVISALFCWKNTPQGHTYWEDIHEKYAQLPAVTKLGNIL